MTDEALKPCPFCGGKSEFIRIDDDNDPCFGGVVVSCLGCGASSKVYFPLKEDVKPLLLEQWNRRAVLAEQAALQQAPAQEPSPDKIDALRYRHIRQDSNWPAAFPSWPNDLNNVSHLRGNDLDTAVDKSRKA